MKKPPGPMGPGGFFLLDARRDEGGRLVRSPATLSRNGSLRCALFPRESRRPANPWRGARSKAGDALPRLPSRSNCFAPTRYKSDSFGTAAVTARVVTGRFWKLNRTLLMCQGGVLALRKLASLRLVSVMELPAGHRAPGLGGAVEAAARSMEPCEGRSLAQTKRSEARSRQAGSRHCVGERPQRDVCVR